MMIEITQAKIPVFKQFYGLWFDHAVPRLGRLAAQNGAAYSYLPASVKRFPDPDDLKGMMEDAGLRNVRYEILAGNPGHRGRGVASATLDGEPVAVREGAARIPLVHDGRLHRVAILLGAGEEPGA